MFQCFLFNYGFSNINVIKAKYQNSGLRSLSLEPISRCNMKNFFQLAVDAAALKLATVTLQNLQVFPYLVNHASLWLFFYALSTVFFSDTCLSLVPDNWVCFQNCKAVLIQNTVFLILIHRKWLAAFRCVVTHPWSQLKA